MKRFLIITAVIIVIVVGFIMINRNQNSADLQEQLDGLQTEAARIDSLVSIIGETGTVRSKQTAFITWGTTGNVKEVLAEIGQFVEKGEILATLDETSVPQNVVLAKADILNAENALEALYDSFDASAVAMANERLQEAWKVFEYAEDNLWNLNQPYSQAKIDQAQANLVLAKDAVGKARDQYEKFENSGNDILIASLKVALANAEISQASVENTLYIYSHGPTEYTIANYEADLEVARTNYEAAQNAYDEILLGPSQDEIDAAEARITAAEMTLDQMFISAPFAGTITDIDILPGDNVNMGSAAFRIDDFSQYIVDVNISEVDINRITAGQEVSLTFDAILNNDYQGAVYKVGQVGMNVQGVIYFEVSIVVANPDEFVKPGMTSGVYITVEKLNDVLVVPNRAVRIDDGDRIVYVLEDEDIVMKKVILGASADAYSEVVSGELVVGDLVILNPPTSIFDLSDGPMGGFGGAGH